MMTAKELERHLNHLDIDATEAALLLGVTYRTVRRWLFDGEEVPGPVEQAFRAWVRLHQRGLAWRADSVSIIEEDQQQIAAHRQHAIAVDEVLSRVEARGGPRLPWYVDRERCRATCGKMEVSFHKLTNGGFSLNQYTRKDTSPDVRRDRDLIDDATWHIAKEMKKDAAIPVTLVYMDGTNFPPAGGQFGSMRHEEFPTNEAAIQRVCSLMTMANLHSFTIRTGTATTTGDFLWNEPELRAECERRKNRIKRRKIT